MIPDKSKLFVPGAPGVPVCDLSVLVEDEIRTAAASFKKFAVIVGFGNYPKSSEVLKELLKKGYDVHFPFRDDGVSARIRIR